MLTSNYREDDLVGYWPLDENSSSSIAYNHSPISGLDGNINDHPERRSGVKGGAFYFDGVDDKIVIPYEDSLKLDQYTVSFWYFPERNNVDYTGLFGRGMGGVRNYAIWQGIPSMALALSFIIDSPKDKILTRESITFILLSGRDGIMSYAPMKDLVVMPEPTLTDLLPSKPAFRKEIGQKLTIDGSTDLHIGVNPDNQNAGYFLGMLMRSAYGWLSVVRMFSIYSS